MLNYNEELNSKKKAIKEKVANQEKRRDALKFNTPNWWKEHKKLEGYRLDLETVISRIKNKDKPIEGLTEHKIIV